MNKVRLLLPIGSGKHFEFSYPDLSFRNNTKSKFFLKLASFLSFTALFLFVILLPSSRYLVFGKDVESNILSFIVLSVGILLALYVFGLILNGKQRVIDPPFFMPILVFALGTTAASVLVTQPNIGNTFGMLGFRTLSGIAVMSFIVLYYLTNFNIFNRTSWIRFFKLFILGIMIFNLYVLLSPFPANEISLQSNFVTLFLGYVGALAWILYSKNTRIIKFVLVGLLFLSTYLTLEKSPMLWGNLVIVLIPALIASIVIVALYLRLKRDFVRRKVSETIALAKEIRTSNKKLLVYNKIVLALVLSPILLLIAILIFRTWGSLKPTIITDALTSIVRAFDNINNLSLGLTTQNVLNFLVGTGSKGFRSTDGFIANIIAMQGLLGILSYLFIWGFGIFKAVKLFQRQIKVSRNYKLIAFLLFVLLYVPIFGIFTNISILIFAFWWIAFILVSVFYRLIKQKDLEYRSEQFDEVRTFNFKFIKSRRVNLYLRYLFASVLLIVIIYVAYNFVVILNR